MAWLQVIVSEVIFGVGYAVVLDRVPVARFLVEKRTWLTVVVGVAVTVLLAVPVIGWQMAGCMAGIFALSGLGVIGRSIVHEMRSDGDFWGELRRLARGECGDDCAP